MKKKTIIRGDFVWKKEVDGEVVFKRSRTGKFLIQKNNGR